MLEVDLAWEFDFKLEAEDAESVGVDLLLLLDRHGYLLV